MSRTDERADALSWDSFLRERENSKASAKSDGGAINAAKGLDEAAKIRLIGLLKKEDPQTTGLILAKFKNGDQEAAELMVRTFYPYAEAVLVALEKRDPQSRVFGQSGVAPALTSTDSKRGEFLSNFFISFVQKARSLDLSGGIRGYLFKSCIEAFEAKAMALPASEQHNVQGGKEESDGAGFFFEEEAGSTGSVKIKPPSADHADDLFFDEASEPVKKKISGIPASQALSSFSRSGGRRVGKQTKAAPVNDNRNNSGLDTSRQAQGGQVGQAVKAAQTLVRQRSERVITDDVSEVEKSESGGAVGRQGPVVGKTPLRLQIEPRGGQKGAAVLQAVEQNGLRSGSKDGRGNVRGSASGAFRGVRTGTDQGGAIASLTRGGFLPIGKKGATRGAEGKETGAGVPSGRLAVKVGESVRSEAGANRSGSFDQFARESRGGVNNGRQVDGLGSSGSGAIHLAPPLDSEELEQAQAAQVDEETSAAAARVTISRRARQLTESLKRLANSDLEAYRTVVLRYFAGNTFAELCQNLEVSSSKEIGLRLLRGLRTLSLP